MKKRDDDIYNKIGIYGIRNVVNGKIYVGKTGMNFGDRWDSHRSLLNNNKHSNPYLQNAWNKYGNDNFEFIILEECAVGELNEREIYYISYYREQNLSYNIYDGGDGGILLGKHLSDETKKKIGEKNKINSSGKVHSEETKLKMSEAHKGKKYKAMSEEGRKNIGESQQRFYEEHPKKLTVEDVINIRKLHIDGQNYSEIARQYAVTPQCINDICNYKRWKQVA